MLASWGICPPISHAKCLAMLYQHIPDRARSTPHSLQVTRLRQVHTITSMPLELLRRIGHPTTNVAGYASRCFYLHEGLLANSVTNPAMCHLYPLMVCIHSWSATHTALNSTSCSPTELPSPSFDSASSNTNVSKLFVEWRRLPQ